jgi:ABC-type transport system involved in multi-copper enzyme maturation permease subunit
MTTGTITGYRSELRAGPDGFRPLLRAEWIKLRTVRGWMIGIIIAPVLTVGIALLNHSRCGDLSTPEGSAPGSGCAQPVGPGGEAVTDSFYFVHQPLAGTGRITVRVTALTGPNGQGQAGLPPWAKAGIIVKASTRPGSAYAALMVTAGHGVQMQYDYTGDIAGPPGPAAPTSPRWLRLTRTGDLLTGYESADGARWHLVGAAHLARLPATVQAGLFTAAPGSTQSTVQSIGGSSGTGEPGLVTARFDHVSLRAPQSGGAWTGDQVGGRAGHGAVPGAGFRQAGGTVTVTGSGDIAPDVPAAADGGGFPIEHTLLGAFGGLIAVIVVAAMFMTAEYRRGLIRVTLTASPRRGRVLAAKAVVIGSVTFAAGLAGAAAAVPLGERLMRSNGNYILPVSTLTEVRVVAGTAALLAVAAVLALALGALLRSSAAAVTVAIAATVLPYLMATTVLIAGPGGWLLRFTPAAAFAIQQSTPQYPQVSASYTPMNGYFPLAPWAGFAVLCGYAVLALGLAVIRLRRTDA